MGKWVNGKPTFNGDRKRTMTVNSTAIFIRSSWVLANFLGWFAGAVLIILTSGLFDSIGLEGFQFYLGISMGAGIGYFQWKILRHHSIGAEWIVSSIVGLGAPFLLVDLMKRYGGLPDNGAWLQVCVSFGGVIVAFWQSRLLQRRGIRSVRWLFAGWAGWVLAAATVLAMDYTKYLSSNKLVLFFLNLTLIIAGGAALGVVTAPTMQRLLTGRSA